MNQLPGKASFLTTWFFPGLALLIALQTIYVAYFGAVDITLSRTLLVLGACAITLWVHSPGTRQGEERPRLASLWRVVDLILIAILAYAIYHLIFMLKELEESMVDFASFDIFVGFTGVCVILEATRRAFGWPIVLVAIASLLFLWAGPYLPGFLSHSGFDMSRAMQLIWFGFQGVFGVPLGVVIQVVMIFIVFGVILEKTGASDSLIRVSLALAGGTKGGPAHAAVIASAMFGSMSGSVTANVVGTGSFTIPMIRRRGFRPALAGAIEAAASTGGQIVPPVMGAAAFLMADLLNMSYGQIVIAALIPALFYYGALFVAISVEAGKAGIEPLPASEKVVLNRDDYIASLGFLLPIAIIASTLTLGYSAAMAGVLATVATVLLGLFRREVRQNALRIYIGAFVKAGIACSSILVVVACIGVVIGAMNLTGLGISFASMVAEHTGGSLLVALLITAAACLALGMGMPTLPAYMIIVLVLGPALAKMGVEPLVAHMFVFYFGVLSAITPPVAIGAFAAAPIAGAKPMATAVVAVRLALAGFIIPFVFVYQPQLLLVGDFDFLAFSLTAICLAMAILFMTTTMAGYASGPLSVGQRLLHGLITIGLLIQMPAVQIPVFVVAVGVLFFARSARKPGALNA